MPGWVLYLDGHLISLTTLQVQAQNDAARRTEIYRQMAEMRVKPPVLTEEQNGGGK